MDFDQDLTIRPVEEEDYPAVIQLWDACGLVVPYNPPLEDLQRAAGKPASDVLVGVIGSRPVASVMVGHDGHRGWIYYLAVDPACQHQGYGARMVTAAEEWLAARDIRKVQLMVRETNTRVTGFYEHLGYERSKVVVMQRWLDGTSTS
jgi:ribosomal protein S18 acetylase RimI-like enzyme